VRAGPVLRAAWAGAGRRLVQSGVVLAVLGVSCAAALTAMTLVFAANQGTAAAVTVTHGADLAVTINADKVSAGQLAATRHLPGVTQDAGPYPQTTITVATGGAAAGHPGGGGLLPTGLTVVGRASPSGSLDDIIANPSIMAGMGTSRWPDRPGQVSLAFTTGIRVPLGSKLTVVSAPGRPVLTVTGYAQTQENYEDAWVTPGEIAALRPAGAPAQDQMLYTFASDSTNAQLSADLAELKAALPGGAVASSQSLVNTGEGPPGGNVNTRFVLAFAVLALVLAVLVVANVVSGAVVASYRRIGVLKSIGFTPAQVTAVYLAQISIPAVAGAVAGTVLGNWQVLPVLGLYEIQGAHVFVPLWINLTVPLAMLALTGLAAAVPAARAGRLHAVEAITAGQAPRAGRGAAPYRLAARLPLPETVTTGLAAPFSRPARSAVTLAALLFGLTGVVLGASLNSSVHKINDSAISGLGQLQAAPDGRTNTLSRSQAAAAAAAIHAQPGTQHYVGETDLMSGVTLLVPSKAPVNVGIAGQPDLPLTTYAYDGDSSWLGWALVSGHWYNGPGEIDVSADFTALTGKTTGDLVTLTVNGKPVSVRIAGEVFLPNVVPTVFLGWQTLGGQAAGLTVNQYDIDLTPGTSTAGYSNALQRALGPGIGVGSSGNVSFAAGVDLSLFRWLTVLIAALAALGVLNAALMATRERVHDLGVFKAVGMTPRQVITMVTCWVIGPAVIAAAIALPAGLTAQDLLVHQLASSNGGMVSCVGSCTGPAWGSVLPASFVHVLGGIDLLLLVLAGLAIAIAGTLGPATWAARTRTSAVLRTE
jgi:putative ABC transport system permease protein